MRGLTAVTLALTLVFSAIPAVAQQKPATDSKPEADRSKLGARSVTGTVKKTTDNGFVVVGRESGQKDREWAFVLDEGTRINADGKVRAAKELREGDAVTVTYTNRDGKIVAQSVKVNPQ
jgi:Cu/Ag efflux protein CusF